MTAVIHQATEKAKANWRSIRSALFRKLLSPAPRITVSEWADRYRILSRENSASPGRWRTDRVPYMREIMDTANDPKVDVVIFKKCAQVAGTEGCNNIIGFFIHQDPSPILYVQTTEGEAEKYSKEKLAPMIRDTPELRELVSDVRSRNSENTILAKRYTGGHLGMVGANAPAGLRSRSRRIVICDDYAGFPLSAGTEGPPVQLAETRSITFWNRKRYRISTPTLKGDAVDQDYEASDQRRYHVPCPHCGVRQVLWFPRLSWDKVEWRVGEERPTVPLEWGEPILRGDFSAGTITAHYPETAVYPCEGCGAAIEESEKRRMLLAGVWVAAHPERRMRGYHLNALYSPWVRWHEMVREFLEAKDHPEKLRTFVNLKLGEAFEEQRDGIGADALAKRCEPYAAEVPSGVALLTAAIDVQGDRLELKVKGWGPKEESWLIAHQVFEGDPDGEDVWARADEELVRGYQHEDGAILKIRSTVIDSGGHHADAVYRFAKKRAARSLFVIKGSSTASSPIWPTKRPKKTKTPVRIWMVGTDTAKDVILLSRLKRANPGPGYMHFPEGTPPEYFEQLTSEVKKPDQGPRGRIYRWQKQKAGARNEALDLEVYCLAALYALGKSVYEKLDGLLERVRAEGAERRAKPEEPTEEGVATAEQVTPRRRGVAQRRRGWMRY